MDNHQVQLLFLGLASILFVARAAGYIAGRMGQPPVVGEIVAGVTLGAGMHSLSEGATMLPADVLTALGGLAAVGLAWFMFSIGLELDIGGLRSRKVVSAAASSTLVAFGLGVAAAFVLLDRHPNDHPALFAIFLGLAMSVTAFPVLARILADRRMLNTRVGNLSLTLAALDDVFVWSALAALLAATSDRQIWVLLLAVPYVAVMVLVVGPLLRRLTSGSGDNGTPAHVAVFGLALVSAAATEAVGLHFVFGAFLTGVVVKAYTPGVLGLGLRDRAEKLSSLLLPVYFVIAGLRIDLGALDAQDVLDGLLILAVAVAGKFGGGYLGARRYGLDRAEAGVLATLINTRGLTELVLLEIGYRAGLIDQSLYSVLVAMAVITTVMTGPALSLLSGSRRVTGRAGADATARPQPEPVPVVVAAPAEQRP